MQPTETVGNPRACIAGLLADSTEKAKEGEFLKTAEAKLKALAESVSDEENKYRNGEGVKRDTLVTEWKEQDRTICEQRKRLESCYGDWREILRTCVCERVIKEVRQLWDGYTGRIGQPETDLYLADRTLSEAAAKLDAWKSITEWIQARLKRNQDLMTEICELDSCKEHRFALYIFYFELLPAHEALGEQPITKDPEREYCSPACDKDTAEPTCCIYPYLIKPDEYDCALAKAWKCWKQAGMAQAKAESEFELIAKFKEDFEAKSDPDAKRKEAAKWLRLCGIEPCVGSKQLS